MLFFQGTESEQESTGNSDPHSFVNHYANVNSTFRQSWKKQKTPIAVPPPRAGHSNTLGAASSSSQGAAGAGAMSLSGGGTLRSGRSHNRHHHEERGVSASRAHNSHHNLSVASQSNKNPRGYSSFTESDQDASSAVVSLNGTQIVMNNMARSRAPLPGFSSFV